MKRNTCQREAILGSLHASGRSLSPPEILHEASTYVPNLSLATVYRQLKTLVEEGAIDQVDLPGQSPRFEARCALQAETADHHHHHFHCEVCERVFPIHACPGPMDRLAPAGFVVQRHDVTLHGRCASCAQKIRNVA
jgi:Fur family ferric uptake transcriptional regulator